jgi:hypothetical protein
MGRNQEPRESATAASWSTELHIVEEQQSFRERCADTFLKLRWWVGMTALSTLRQGIIRQAGNIFQPGTKKPRHRQHRRLSASNIKTLDVIRNCERSRSAFEPCFHILAWTTFGTGLIIESTKTGEHTSGRWRGPTPSADLDFRLQKDAKGKESWPITTTS